MATQPYSASRLKFLSQYHFQARAFLLKTLKLAIFSLSMGPTRLTTTPILTGHATYPPPSLSVETSTTGMHSPISMPSTLNSSPQNPRPPIQILHLLVPAHCSRPLPARHVSHHLRASLTVTAQNDPLFANATQCTDRCGHWVFRRSSHPRPQVTSALCIDSEELHRGRVSGAEYQCRACTVVFRELSFVVGGADAGLFVFW
jgi:hypothetical protein